tara:strand:- start:30 stop:575 length:546 start_codon:yes stop_codon:yes gene_type:complete
MRQNSYQEDRKDSDEFFYKIGYDEIKEKIKESKLYGPEIIIKKSSEYDDNYKVNDAWINGNPSQIRIQFIENKKECDYYATIRYRRSHTQTEIIKLIEMDEKNEPIPNLIWMLVDRENKLLLKLVIVDLESIIHKRKNKYKLNNNYRLTDDYEEKKNSDGQTSFLILKNTEDYLYSYSRKD